MGAGRALRRLWRHAGFRRLLTLRALSQSADGTVQVGMAAYLLFSPASQPDAWSIAAILAITFLPFTLLGHSSVRKPADAARYQREQEAEAAKIEAITTSFRCSFHC